MAGAYRQLGKSAVYKADFAVMQKGIRQSGARRSLQVPGLKK
jgi:hypothetical protein